jgi:ATP-binding cassette subfamily F protein 3
VALAKLVLLRANFLLLDEPTNHLDIASQEILEEVLDNFAGTIVLVTHDRYLVDRLASQLWIIDSAQQALDVFKGSWGEYVEARNREAQQPEVRQAKDKWSRDQRRLRREEQRARREQEARQQQAAEIEAEIHRLEQELQALQEEIAAATESKQAMRIHELGTIYGELEGQLHEQMERWAALAS